MALQQLHGSFRLLLSRSAFPPVTKNQSGPSVEWSLCLLRFQQQICSDHAAVRAPSAGPAFPALRDAVRRLLPYHACAGHLPAQRDFDLGP